MRVDLFYLVWFNRKVLHQSQHLSVFIVGWRRPRSYILITEPSRTDLPAGYSQRQALVPLKNEVGMSLQEFLMISISLRNLILEC